jgi:hypothetical protein
MAKVGLSVPADPPPLKLNEPELLLMVLTLPPLLTLQLGQAEIVRAFTAWNDDGELEEFGLL